MNHMLIGKKILAVDDEPDILETLVEFLDMCAVETATDFESARRLLVNNHYDAAILDIMGVNGYDLLNLAKVKGIPALMLTAHALSPEHLEKSIGNGAFCYLPKEEMIDIAEHLCDMLMAKDENSPTSRVWFDKLAPCFENKWGSDWKRGRMETLSRLNLVHSKDELEKIL
ncbi:MAG: response regulator [Desulfosarcina sp.]|nr:response regulator [Desulfosarcina sp.]MBC2744716.1 response regulator [Desulfosarcina sp.]MBC2767625.1 response regulator [Desulfosarcina sp.]